MLHASSEPAYQPRKWNSMNQVMATHNCYSYMLNDLYYSPRKNHKPQPGHHYIRRTKSIKYKGIENINCDHTVEGVLKDNPHIKVLSIKEGKTKKIPKHYYKGILVVSPNNDYHFARCDNRLLKIYSEIIAQRLENISDRKLVSIILHLCKRFLHKDIMEKIPTNISQKQQLKLLYKYSKTWSHKPGSSSVTDRDADGKIIFDPVKANWNFESQGGQNYSVVCCFFHVPANKFKPTYSSGVSLSPFNSLQKRNMRSNIYIHDKEALLDIRVQKIIKTI